MNELQDIPINPEETKAENIPDNTLEQQSSETKASQLPPGFSLRSRTGYPGLYYTEYTEGKATEETRIGPPLVVRGATRDENGKSWGLYLEWRDQDGRLHKWAMP